MKNRLVKSTIILMIGGLITKLLGMIIRISMSRSLGTTGIGYYMLIMPTFTLFISLAQAGFPTAISKLVSEDKKNNKNLVFSLIPISLLINFILIIIIFLSADIIANKLLHQSIVKEAIICIGLVLPFISISSLLRGYFFGKEKMVPHVISNIVEDLVRLIIIVLFVPLFLTKGIKYAVSFVVLSNIASELTSILILFIFLPKNFCLKKKDIIPNLSNIKDTLIISVPTTFSRIIGSIGYFLEPIIISYVLLSIGYSNSFVVDQYGVINGYVMPILLLPSFFTMAISNALLPIISNSYSKGKYKYTKDKIKQAIIFSLLIGIPFSCFVILNPSFLLNILYNTNEGINYIRWFAPICLLHYIQAPLTSSLQAMGKASTAMLGTLVGMIIRTLSLLIFSFLHIGLYSLLIATGLNIIYVTIHHYIKIKKYLK